MIKTAYCKINLTLEILGTKRADGFHDLKSVMHKIPLGDTVSLEVKEGKGDIFFSCSENVCQNEDNLAYRAALAYMEEYSKTGKAPFDVYISLEKVTPTGAGLGGGSADAACVLDMLEGKLSALGDENVEKIAARLGSDVVFCLEKYKCAYCSGRGEVCESINTLPDGVSIVLAKPKESLNTKGIYKSYDEQWGDDYSKSNTDLMVEALKKADLKKISDLCVNDFEQVCIPRLNEIQAIKEKMLLCGAVVSKMSGSGSAVFGLFDSEEKSFACKELLLREGLSEVFAFADKDFKKMYLGE